MTRATYLLIAIVIAGCAGAAPTPAPVATATAKPTPTATARATPTLAPAAAAAAHITSAALTLSNLSDLQPIVDWIMYEQLWLKGQPDLPLLVGYRSTIDTQFLLIKAAPSIASIRGAALAIMAAAYEVPGVTGP
jgi:hypothetical protein